MMNSPTPATKWPKFAVMLLAFAAGCARQDSTEDAADVTSSPGPGEHAKAVDPHDVPLTDQQKQRLREETAQFADALSRIESLSDSVRRETMGGLPDNPLAAHQALDQVDLILQWLPDIARDSNVSKEYWESINRAANQLRELFEQVHQNVDAGADPDLASVSQQIDAKIKELGTLGP